MDEEALKKQLRFLAEAADVLTKLPSEVRLAAFQMLERGISGGVRKDPLPDRGGENKAGAHVDTTDAEAFFSAHDHEKPADNTKVIAAYIYGQHGSVPFDMDEVRSIASKVGITIPKRPDVTYGGMRSDGKKLFDKTGKGIFVPTVHGEAYLKATYSVKKGTKPRPVDDNA